MKKGVSLIVLVITIVVAILIIGFIVMSLNASNPVSNARITSLASNRDSITTGIVNYTGKISVDTKAKFKKEQILLGNTLDTNDYRIVQKDGTEYVTCNITIGDDLTTLYEIDEDLYNLNVGEFPKQEIKGSAWYLDIKGNVYLVFDSDGKALKWMTTKSGKMEDATLLTFVTYKNGLLGTGVKSN